MKSSYEPLTFKKLSDETIQNLLIKKLGRLDGPALIKKMEEFGIEDLALEDLKLVIPKSQLKDITKFQHKLSILSQAGRSFLTKMDQDYIEINLGSYRADYEFLTEDRWVDTNTLQDVILFLHKDPKSKFFRWFSNHNNTNENTQPGEEENERPLEFRVD